MPARILTKKAFLFLGTLFFLTSCGIKKSLQDMPNISKYEINIPERQKINDSTFALGDNFLTKNKQGHWELFVDGNPLELGLKTGSLTQELFNRQEEIFVKKIDELVPSEGWQNFLRKFLAWFNRKMYLNIDEQYKAEIYGISQYASEDLNHIAEAYPRVMYFHGAHDIGHALQDLALVGCSSFAAWGEQTEDGQLIIGRNFDFYVGEEFSKNKIIAFVKPDKGHNFMSVTWGGFIGVLSGMNDQGLTVTINAGKSDFPLVAKTPISLVTREILQYASNIDEAIAIAKKREVFVSESIFIGSAKDKKAALIEVSPNNFGVYEVLNSANHLICSNHFQSAAYADDKKNQKHILESHSQYRFERMEELLEEKPKVNPKIAVEILRDKKGLDEKDIGYGNEKALNQLLAHHGIVFKPEELLVWVSSNPYQLGEFVAYDLKGIFSEGEKSAGTSMSKSSLNIEKDPFLHSEAYLDYERYRELKDMINSAISKETPLGREVLGEFEESNPEFWEVHYLIALYNYNRGYDTVALKAFEKAASKEITTVPDREKVERYIRKIKRSK